MRVAALALLLALALGACGPRSAPAPAHPNAVPDVTVNVCGVPTAYPKEPKRAVTYDVGITEMFLFLGLADRLVGYAGIPDGKEIAPEFAPALARLPKLSTQGMNLETLVNAGTDFVFGGWSYGFRQGGVTPELLARHGIASYVLTESCIHVAARSEVRLEDAFDDMRHIGAIFRSSAQADQQVAVLAQGLATLRREMAGVTHRPRVFVYDSGDKLPTTSGRYGMPRAMLHEAGADNLFDDIASNWPQGNWEDVVTRDPEWIVIVDYGHPSAEGKRHFLMRKPELAGVSAIRHQRFFVMTYAEATPGPRNVATTQRLAAALHPERRITVDPPALGTP